MGVWTLFEHGARRWPRRVCLDDGSQVLTYRDVMDRTALLAAGLLKNAPVGAKVAVLSPNSTAAMCALLAVYRANAIFVPLNASFPIAEHETALCDLNVEVLLFHSTLASHIEPLLASVDSLREAICIDGDAGVGTSLPEWIERGAEVDLPDPPRSPSDIVAIYPTGGSTGKPRRVMHNRLTWSTMAASFHTALPVKGHATYLLAPPLTHAAGAFALMLMAAGATTIIHRGFDADEILKTIETRRVTHVYLPPTAIYKLLDHPEIHARDCSSLTAFMYTAAPMSLEKLKECIAAFGPVMVQFWGQMEAPSFCTCLTPEDHVVDDPAVAGRLLSCGRETMFTKVEVIDDNGAIVPVGERGELVVRSNLVMAGYYQNPEATAEVTRDGWHLTGDLGYKDTDGYVYIVGRKRDLIITGGYNVYPADVEQVLWSHPLVEECAVIGVPDDLWGEAILAVVQPKAGRTISEAELIDFCKVRIGSVKAPKRIDLREEMPRNAVGKVDRLALREPYWRGRSRSI